MYQTFKEAGDWMLANPAEAAKLAAQSIKGSDEAAIRKLIEDNGRLGLNIGRAADIKPAIQAVYAVGRQSGYLAKDVDDSTIYVPAK
jgi:ABC-type nitrate/sulfonate/bicarbonate transport system substrate-binding protein